jgi:hypothetical protein
MTLLKAYLRGQTDPISLTKAFAEDIIEKAHKAIEKEVERFLGIGMSWKEFVSQHEKLMVEIADDIYDRNEYLTVLSNLIKKPETKLQWDWELPEGTTSETIRDEMLQVRRNIKDLEHDEQEAKEWFLWIEKEYRKLLKQVSGYESLDVANQKEIIDILDIGIELLENELKIVKDTAAEQNILSRRDTKWLKERKKVYEKRLTQVKNSREAQTETSKYHEDLEIYFKESKGKKIGEKKHYESLIKNLETRLEEAKEKREKAKSRHWKELFQSADVRFDYGKKEVEEVVEEKDRGISEFSLKNPPLVEELADVLYDRSKGKRKDLGEKLLEIIGKFGDEIDKPLEYDSFKGTGGTSERRAFGYRKTSKSKKRTPVSPDTLIKNYRELIEILEKGKKNLELNPQEEWDLNTLLKNLSEGIEKQQKRKEKEVDEPEETSTSYGERRYDPLTERKELTEEEIRNLENVNKFIANLLSDVIESGRNPDIPKTFDDKKFTKLSQKLKTAIKGIMKEEISEAELIEFGSNYKEIAEMISKVRIDNPPDESIDKLVRDWIRYRDEINKLPDIGQLLGEHRTTQMVRNWVDEKEDLEDWIYRFRRARDKLFDDRKAFENRTHEQPSDEEWEKEVREHREKLDGERRFRGYMDGHLNKYHNKEAINKIIDRIISGEKVPERLLKDVVKQGRRRDIPVFTKPAISGAAEQAEDFGAQFGTGTGSEQQRDIEVAEEGSERGGGEKEFGEIEREEEGQRRGEKQRVGETGVAGEKERAYKTGAAGEAAAAKRDEERARIKRETERAG